MTQRTRLVAGGVRLLVRHPRCASAMTGLYARPRRSSCLPKRRPWCRHRRGGRHVQRRAFWPVCTTQMHCTKIRSQIWTCRQSVPHLRLAQKLPRSPSAVRGQTHLGPLNFESANPACHRRLCQCRWCCYRTDRTGLTDPDLRDGRR